MRWRSRAPEWVSFASLAELDAAGPERRDDGRRDSRVLEVVDALAVAAAVGRERPLALVCSVERDDAQLAGVMAGVALEPAVVGAGEHLRELHGPVGRLLAGGGDEANELAAQGRALEVHVSGLALVRRAGEDTPREAELSCPGDSRLLFPNSRGGYLDFRNFNRRHWKPVQKSVGIEPLRDLYDLRHTYATFALRAGVPVFALSRFMGTSIAMIDLHYGHLAVDSYQHAVSLLDALASSERWTLRGRRNRSAQRRSTTGVRGLARSARSEPWTLGGRRASPPSSNSTTKGVD